MPHKSLPAFTLAPCPLIGGDLQPPASSPGLLRSDVHSWGWDNALGQPQKAGYPLSPSSRAPSLWGGPPGLGVGVEMPTPWGTCEGHAAHWRWGVGTGEQPCTHSWGEAMRRCTAPWAATGQRLEGSYCWGKSSPWGGCSSLESPTGGCQCPLRGVRTRLCRGHLRGACPSLEAAAIGRRCQVRSRDAHPLGRPCGGRLPSAGGGCGLRTPP